MPMDGSHHQSNQKPLPCDVDAECHIIGAILHEQHGKKALQQAIDSYLSTEHLYGAASKITFSAILTLQEAGQEVNLYTVIEQLETSGEDQELAKYISGKPIEYLDECIENCIMSDIGNAIERVKQKARRRMILKKSQQVYNLIQSVNNESVDVEEAFQSLKSIVDDIEIEAEDTIPFRKSLREGYRTGSELQAKEFPPIRWIAEGYLPEGLTMLAGKPKMGKSWLMLVCGLAVAYGGKFLNSIDVEKGEVLYLDLDGNERRLRSRIDKIMQGEAFPDGFYYCNTHERGLKGVQRLDKWLSGHGDARLIIIDTFVKFRERSTAKSQDTYEKDTHDLYSLQQLAEKHHIGIVCIHHQRKMGSDDLFDTVLGSIGMTGGVDTVAIMKRDRTRSDAVLTIDGKDMENPVESAIEFDRTLGIWKLLGKAEDYRQSIQRQEILDILAKSKEPLSPKQIAGILQKNHNTTRWLLSQLFRDQKVGNISGKYFIANTTNSTNTTNSANKTNGGDLL